jgi:hypothetical protein
MVEEVTENPGKLVVALLEKVVIVEAGNVEANV